MFYTNVAQYGNSILYVGYDDAGRKIRNKIKYKPTLYVPSKKGSSDYFTLDREPVDKVSFDSIKDARDFVDKYRDIANFSIYGMSNWKYAYISDKFEKEVKFNANLIRVVNIDIEVKLPEGFDSFVENASEPITALTMRMNDRTLVFAYKDSYKPKKEGVYYVKCKDEFDLLGRFLQAWNSDLWQPDVITGWNVEFFDVPYLVNRITKVLGQDHAKRLSPWRLLFEKSVTAFGREQQSYTPVGISILDYMQLYKKFTYNQQESYSLNHISYVELGEKKVDYSEYQNLDVLYENDFEKYIDYNIHDVELVHKLDEKLKLMDLIFTMTYDAKINYSDSLGSVLPWEIVIYNYLRSFNTVMPFKSKNVSESYTGAYVKEPIPGLYDWVVSFDLTSLYPHLIIQYNISPETRKGKQTGVSVDNILEGVTKNDTSHCMAANGCLYDNLRIGFLPALMKRFFAKRKEYKNKMIHFQKLKQNGAQVDNEIAKYNNAQMAMKIFLNSAYGAVGNKYFTFYNNDNAEAITLSGQLSIRWIEQHINKFLNDKLGTTDADYVIAMDTDSLYLNMADVVNRFLDSGNGTDSTTDALDVFSEKIIQPEIDKAYKILAETMGAHENAMSMKREAISSKAIWKAKKMYVLNVIDNEGIRYKVPELKIMGIEAIRSSIPEVCRQAMKDCLKIIMNEDNDALIAYIEKFRNNYETMSFADIASPRGVKGISKYKGGAEIYIKGTPIHTKASLIHNSLVRKHKLGITPIYDGDKIKFVYLKTPNPIKQEVIASHGYLPKEFGVYEYIDRNTQFEKTFLDPFRAITDIIGWKTEEKHLIEDFY